MTQYLGLIEPNFTFQNRHTFLQPMHDHAGGLKDLQISLQFASSNRFCEMYPRTTTLSEIFLYGGQRLTNILKKSFKTRSVARLRR